MGKTVPLTLRKPPQVSATDVDAFVSDGAGSSAPKPSPTISKAEHQPKGKVQRADGTEARRLVVYLPPDVMQRLRMQCAESEVTLSAAVTEALRAHL